MSYLGAIVFAAIVYGLIGLVIKPNWKGFLVGYVAGFILISIFPNGFLVGILILLAIALLKGEIRLRDILGE